MTTETQTNSLKLPLISTLLKQFSNELLRWQIVENLQMQNIPAAMPLFAEWEYDKYESPAVH